MQDPAAPAAPSRSKQLKNLREATRSFKDRLAETGGLYDGIDGDRVLEFVAIGEEILQQYSPGDLKIEDRCSLFFNCLAGTAKEIVRAAKLGQPGVLTDVEELKTTLITQFMGEGSMFEVRGKAWSTYQKTGENAREWAARISLLLTYNARKEVIDSKKYKEYISANEFADKGFTDDKSQNFRLHQYDWMSIKYYDSMLRYFTTVGKLPPWHAAMYEPIRDDDKTGPDEERYPTSEGGGEIDADGGLQKVPTKRITTDIPYLAEPIKHGPVGQPESDWAMVHVPMNNYVMTCSKNETHDVNVDLRPAPTTAAEHQRQFLQVDGKSPTLDIAARRIFNRGMLAGLAIEKYRALIHEILTIFIRNSLPEIRSHLVEAMDTLRTLKQAVLLAEKVQIAKDLHGKTNINLLQMEGEEEDDG